MAAWIAVAWAIRTFVWESKAGVVILTVIVTAVFLVLLIWLLYEHREGVFSWEMAFILVFGFAVNSVFRAWGEWVAVIFVLAVLTAGVGLYRKYNRQTA